MGHRMTSRDCDNFHKGALDQIPRELKSALMPLIKQIAGITAGIRQYDKTIKTLATKTYPECQLLQTITGVGPLTAVAFRLVVGDPWRFRRSRDVAAYFGLTRKRDQSGSRDPDLAITKAGNKMMRRLLVGCAQHILGPQNKKDSELRQWGLKLAGPPKSNGKRDAKSLKRAVVAVARKTAVLMHTLWTDGMVYEPFFQQRRQKVKNHAQ